MSREDRVELRWPGKRGADEPAPEGLELEVEQRVGASADNLLICADNLLAMQALQATHAGAIDLIYLDPPFATGHDFVRTSFAGGEGEGRAELRAHAYHDRWPGGLAGFLRMLEPRLRLCHRLLAPQGSLYLHVDPTVGHYAKLVLDEVFGPGCFQREIVWRIGWLSGYKTRANNWIRNHDLIFYYTKDPARFTFNKQYVPHPAGYRRRDGAAARSPGVPMEDVWNANAAEFALRGRDSLDSIQIKSFSREKTGWATQKNTSLLRRIIAASSRPGELVADFFCGSGTALVAAAELGRRFIGCDCALPAVELAHARLLELRGDVPADMSHPPGFARCGLGLAERRLWLGEDRAAAHVDRLLRHHGATPAPGAAALHGLRAEVGVLVGPWEAPLGRAAVRAALAEAAARGLAGLDALAWAWDFPADEDLAAGTGVALTCLQLRRELLDERALAREGAGLGERPAFALEWRAGPEQTVQLVLCGASLRRPERLAPDLRAALADWRELIDSWSVEFAAAGGPLRPDQRQHRTRNQRGLVVESAPARITGPCWARVEVVDRLGAAHPLDFTLRWSEGRLISAPGRPERDSTAPDLRGAAREPAAAARP